MSAMSRQNVSHRPHYDTYFHDTLITGRKPSMLRSRDKVGGPHFVDMTDIVLPASGIAEAL